MEASKTKWGAAIEPFVRRFKMDSATVTQKIIDAKLVESADDGGADVLMDGEAIDASDFRAAFPDVAKGTLNLAIKEVRALGAPVATPTTSATTPPPVMPANPTIGAAFVIPDVPEGSAFLDALSTSKTVAVDVVTIRAAMEALFADSRALAEIPERLADAMERHADSIEEPVGDAFLDILKFVRERRYADINVEGRLVTKERKNVVLARLRELPVAVYQFHQVLAGWHEQLKSNRASNPFGVLQGGANALYPPADDVIAAAEGIAGYLRKAFGGFGVMVAKAMAYEGLKIKETLERPELPALVGAANREIMLRQLKIDLTNADVRTERNIARYVIFAATVVNKSLPGGQEGPVLESLFNLGQTILPWMTGSSTRVVTSDGSKVVINSDGSSYSNKKGRRERDASYQDPHPVGQSANEGPFYRS